MKKFEAFEKLTNIWTKSVECFPTDLYIVWNSLTASVNPHEILKAEIAEHFMVDCECIDFARISSNVQ